MAILSQAGCSPNTSALMAGGTSGGTGAAIPGAGGSGLSPVAGSAGFGHPLGGARPGGSPATGGASIGGATPASGGASGVAGFSGQSGSSSVGGSLVVGGSSSAGAPPLGGSSAAAGFAGQGGSAGGIDPGGAGGASGGAGTEGGVGTAGSGVTPAEGGTSGGVPPEGGTAGTSGGVGGAPSAIVEVVDIASTYSGQPMDMALLTVGNRQFVGFWGSNKGMTVASRTLGSPTWDIRPALPPTTTNDAHHSIVLAADKNGYLHLSGRMHNNPLTYFRTTAPLDIYTFEQVSSMVGTDETSCTYPQFFTNSNGDLVFWYRSGASGSGDTVYDLYDAANRTWSRPITTKFIDGAAVDGGVTNSAYTVGPVKGPDGYWHLVWVWRVDANCETNHDLSYARTRDFVSWESGTGAPLTLPITLGNADIVDPVPVNGGMINNNTKIGFDSQNRPVVVYHKFESADMFANTQLYNARVEGDTPRWVTHQTSNWPYRWAFSGANTINFQIEVEGLKAYADGTLKQRFYHWQYGWGGFLLDEATLAATATIPPPLPYPPELDRVESATADMHPRWAADTGSGPDPDIYYMIRWETLSPNGDQPRNPEPPPTTLRLYGFRRSVVNPGGS